MVITNSRYDRKESNSIKINLDLLTLDILCRYVLQGTSFVKMEHLVNLRKLLYALDYSVYENDPDKVKRIKFLQKALEARLDDNIVDRDIVLTYVNGGLSYPVDFLDYNKIDLTKDEICYVHKLISETLQYQFIYSQLDNIQDVCTRFKVSDYANRGPIVKEMEMLVDNLKTGFRKSRINDNSTEMTFSLRDAEFVNAITNTWNMITNPSRRLICGMQGLNEMTGGGFESGRVYMLLGTSGVGKSVTLLNLIYQIKRFNINYKPKDPTKIPCIVLLTMENTVVETITRLFDMVIENSHGMENYSLNEVIDMLRNEGGLTLSDSSPIDIVIKYKPNKSVNTSYLYTLCDDLDDDGYEVICLVQDHVKRIRSVDASTDLRLELGDIVNEMKVFAANKDIPVITNSHLNRDAAKIIEDAARKANQDTGKLLGKSNIGESMLMIDNLDMAMIITLDFDKDENRYMTFNAVKVRTKNARTYIAQPFVRGSTIRLVEDIGGIPQFKESIHTAPELKKNTVIKISGTSTMTNNIDDVIDINDEDLKDNAFSKKTYTLDNIPSINEIIKPIEFIGINTMGNDIMNLRNQLQISNTIQEPNLSNGFCPIEFDASLIKVV